MSASEAEQSWPAERSSGPPPPSAPCSRRAGRRRCREPARRLPGGAQLAALGERDLALARLAEGHADALAVLAELDGPPVPPGARLGVWAAEPPGGSVTAADGHRRGWRLSGRKQWCSGARALTAALVTATADDGRRLFLVDLGHPGVSVDPDVWVNPGMAGSDTADVELTVVPAVPVGGPGAYLDRAGFWHGGIGVAAVWAGGARGVAAALTDAAVRRGRRPADRRRARERSTGR